MIFSKNNVLDTIHDFLKFHERVMFCSSEIDPHFYTPLKASEDRKFLMFLGGMKLRHWLKMGLILSFCIFESFLQSRGLWRQGGY